jgi:hypothetical protein
MLIGIKGDGQVFPLYQVSTHGMPPVHGAPDGAIGIILIEKMIFPFVVNHAVGIIHPHAVGCEMVKGAMGLPKSRSRSIRGRRVLLTSRKQPNQ